VAYAIIAIKKTKKWFYKVVKKVCILIKSKTSYKHVLEETSHRFVVRIILMYIPIISAIALRKPGGIKNRLSTLGRQTALPDLSRAYTKR
jgi:hypothetical protein